MTTQMHLKCITLSIPLRSQTQKAIYRFHLYNILEKANQRDCKQIIGCQMG